MARTCDLTAVDARRLTLAGSRDWLPRRGYCIQAGAVDPVLIRP